MENKILLSICIPTYNRVDALKKTLPQVIGFVDKNKYNIDIVVGDNASTDGTEEYVKNLNCKYIKYYRNNENISADDNFYKILKYSEGQYTYLLGDKHYIVENNFNKILNILEQKIYPAVVAGVCWRNSNIKSKLYKEPVSFITELGWYYTLISSIFFSRNIIDSFNVKTYNAKNFIHHFILTQYLFEKNAEVLWQNIQVAKTLTDIKPGWEKSAVEIFGRNWTNYILGLPFDININIRREIIKSHSKNTYLFNFMYYHNLRKKYNLTVSDIEKYKDYFEYFSQIRYEKVCDILEDRFSVVDRMKFSYDKIKIKIKKFLNLL